MCNPRVYVGTYAKYNNGSIAGGWISLAECENYGQFLAKCKSLHKNESNPEFMIQDCEGFPDGLGCMEWLSEDEFNDVKAAMKEEESEKPNVSIVQYSEKSFVVKGDTRPIKDDLKQLGGLWFKKEYGWLFSNKKREAVETYLAGGAVTKTEKADKSNDKELLEEYMKEWEKVWKDKGMLDYERKRFSSAIRLENGGILYFEKPSINNKFCFHDEGEQYEHYKKLSSDEELMKSYFKAENLSEYDRAIKGLAKLENWEGDYYGLTWYIQRESYCSQTEPLNLFHYRAFREYDVTNNPSMYEGAEKMTETDRKAIVKALKHERDKFEKRLDAYLKRYGISKLHTWTYWADA